MKEFVVKFVRALFGETALYYWVSTAVAFLVPRSANFLTVATYVVLAVSAGNAAQRLVRIERKLDDVAYDVDLGFLFESADDSQA